MDPRLSFYLSSSENENDERVVRKQLRDRSNPLALSNNAEFIKRFRLSKEAFQYVLPKIKINCHYAKAVPAVLQLDASLSLLASGSYQHTVGSDYPIGMCQSTVSKFTSNVLKEMESKLCPEFIKFQPNESSRCKEWFAEKYKIPGVVGCIDGTHIGLQKPIRDENMYFNRKGYHSFNVMLICDHTCKILAINCQYGGAAMTTHTSSPAVFSRNSLAGVKPFS
ncbi:putative nuclease HARBI1 [Rhagoletis pomonella]|uniref:putative nuclease HARBI1 n=1 Tax=Rhagoletis pomonella TaxID=28610 RepID=UPI00177A7B40|nr:putative nuclease HARBI1 [Rhagoletis pomonella]